MNLALAGFYDECWVFLLEETGTRWNGRVSGVFRTQKAGHLPWQPLCRKEPQSCDGRLLRVLRNDVEQLRLDENWKTLCIVGC